MTIGTIEDAPRPIAALLARLFENAAAITDAARDNAPLDALVVGDCAAAPRSALRAETVVLDVDGRRNRPRFKAAPVVTCGFNPRACVTVSGVADGVMTVCVQRALPTLRGGELPCQEFPVPLGGADERAALAAVTAGLACGLPPNVIGRRLAHL